MNCICIHTSSQEHDLEDFPVPYISIKRKMVSTRFHKQRALNSGGGSNYCFSSLWCHHNILWWHQATANRCPYPLLYHNVVVTKGSNNVCHFIVVGIYLLYGGRAHTTQSCLYFPTALGRCWRGLRCPVMQVIEIPMQVRPLMSWEHLSCPQQFL